VTGLDTLYRQPPKAEVHRHHVGSAPPRIVTELAVGHEGCTRRGTTRSYSLEWPGCSSPAAASKSG
jgi:hypothetical protein